VFLVWWNVVEVFIAVVVAVVVFVCCCFVVGFSYGRLVRVTYCFCDLVIGLVID